MACVETNRKVIDRSIAERRKTEAERRAACIHPADHHEVSDEGVRRLTRASPRRTLSKHGGRGRRRRLNKQKRNTTSD